MPAKTMEKIGRLTLAFGVHMHFDSSAELSASEADDNCDEEIYVPVIAQRYVRLKGKRVL